MKKSILYFLLGIILVACEDSQFSPSNDFVSGGTSKGGSTARFAIKGNILYAVDDQRLNVFDISSESASVLLSNSEVGWGIETIFPYGNWLFLGMQSRVLIYDISTPASPQYISQYAHIVSCDPVVTDGKYAYLTLRTGTNCGLPVNELQILDLTDIGNPVMISSFPMQNPKGLAINGDILYVCDDGIKIYDVSNRQHIILLKHMSGIPANDVIFHRNQLLVTAENGFYQFDASELTPLSYYAF
jgi:hypothetical protein